MHLGEGQNHFADEFSLGCWQLEKSVAGLALHIACALVPAFLLLLNRLSDRFTVTQYLWLNFQDIGQHQQCVVRWNRLTTQPA